MRKREREMEENKKMSRSGSRPSISKSSPWFSSLIFLFFDFPLPASSKEWKMAEHGSKWSICRLIQLLHRVASHEGQSSRHVMNHGTDSSYLDKGLETGRYVILRTRKQICNKVNNIEEQPGDSLFLIQCSSSSPF